MTDAITISPTASRQQLAAQGRSAKGKVTGKLKTAIDLMIWEGLKRGDAAKRAGLQDNSLLVAFGRPHVKTYYLGQLEVLRTSERARNISALAEVRDGNNAMARVAAVKALEQMSEESPTRSMGSVSVPGLVIQIVNNAPLSTHEQRLPSEGQHQPAQVIEHESKPDE